jgi:predicted ATPase/DNA-binding winged helix-turn-helix (wHTH) protein
MQERFNFGEGFGLDTANERLSRNDVVIPLRPKSYGVLRYLIEHAGQLVRKGDLLDAVWPDTAVTDAVLKGCIREIREALEDEADAPRFIVTAHRRGYRFIAAVTSPIDRPAQSMTSTVVRAFGRDGQLGWLQERLDQALRGDRQVVFIAGEPGIGKSTLVDAFVERIAADSSTRIGRGYCIEHHGSAEAYLPVLDAFGRLCRETGGERLVAVLRQHAPTWLAQMPSLVGTADREALAREALGATPPRMLREMAEAIEAATDERPLLLVLEDLHWSDYSTVDLLAALATRRETARLFVVGTYRTVDVVAGGHPLRRMTQELLTHGKSRELLLTELPQEAVAELLAARFPANSFSVELARVLHERTEGHPFFIVSVLDELIRTGVIHSGTGGWELRVDAAEAARAVPETARLMIERQIDGVSAEERRVLEAASVAGVEFSTQAVAAATGDAPLRIEEWCAALARRRQFLQPSRPFDLPDGTMETRYRFLHALYRTVLYDQVPAGRRTQIHRRVGEHLEQVYGEQARNIAAELAVHFEQGQDWKRAVTWLQQAATNATHRSASKEAVALGQRALALLPRLPADAERLTRELGLQMTVGSGLIAIRGYSSHEVEAAHARARELCRQIGDTPELFRVLWGLARFYLVRTPLQTSREYGEELMRLAVQTGDRDFLLQAHNSLGAALFHMGEFSAARDHLEQGLELYDPSRHLAHVQLYVQDPGVVCLVRSGVALWCLGYPDQAATRAHEAIALARRLSHAFSEVFALSWAALIYELRRDWLESRSLADAATELSSREGFSIFVIFGMLIRGAAITALEDGGERGLQELRESLRASDAAGAGLIRSYGLGALARASALNGRDEDARAFLTAAFEAADRTGEHFYDAELRRIEGELLLRSGLPDAGARAETAFRQAMAIADCQHAISWKLRAALSLARLGRKWGTFADARRIVAETRERFTEGFDTPDLKEADAFLEEPVP